MSQPLGTISAEGFSCTITQDDDGRVHFIADADIDADGANGQNGQLAAYKVDNQGSEALANGGMKINASGKVICAHAWARDVVIIDTDNEPKVFPGGVIASKTWYRHRGKAAADPAAYVDAETVPYIVVPPLIVQNTVGAVRGCRAQATWRGRSVACVVADLGPGNRIGELSIAAARALNMPASPRSGGTEQAEVLYELWPGIPAPGFELQPA
ncbi:glycoside hydrolase family 75 protein [Variovorax sp. J22P240]|uniref:glycoside hydrolase family 75 protein n=1 Tax=Variovorax sp. J22P240 TaxID=3053514 RepID=UPI0025751102|nr:glycoside hydrolase family 75 protein [Variovorax sp. J22P240]MDM0001787.1 glycoside hydrolase family 75 protein [Variovorax sp. J22P240]